MRRRIFPVLLLFCACETSEPPRVGVVVSKYPSVAGQLAADDHLAAGGTPFEVVRRFVPESTAAGYALELADSLAADERVLAVVGHPNSAASLAASQVYNREGIVQIAPTSTATVYRDAGPFSFRMVPGDDRQAAFVADAIQSGWPDADRVAVVYVNDDYGRSFHRELRPRLDAVVFEGVYGEMADTTHLLDLIDNIVATRPDVLIWIGRPLRLRIVLQPLRAALPGLRTICGDACDDQAVYANTFGEYEGLRFVRFVDPHSTDPAMQRLQQRYRDEVGMVASAEALLTYDAVRVIGQALSSGARTSDQIRSYLLSLGREREAWQGITGPVAFDSAGDMARSYGLSDVRSDSTVPVPSSIRR